MMFHWNGGVVLIHEEIDHFDHEVEPRGELRDVRDYAPEPPSARIEKCVAKPLRVQPLRPLM